MNPILKIIVGVVLLVIFSCLLLLIITHPVAQKVFAVILLIVIVIGMGYMAGDLAEDTWDGFYEWWRHWRWKRRRQ